LVGIDPRRKVGCGKLGKRQQQVAKIALGIDRNHGDAVDGGLLDQIVAEARLAAAGHAGDERVRDQVRRVVEQGRVGRRGCCSGSYFTAEIEEAKLLEVLHWRTLPSAT